MPTFLFAYANDQQSPRGFLRALARERKAVKAALGLAEQMGLCRREFIDDAAAGDIVGAFQRHGAEIAFFHYGGHAGSFDLLLQTEQGDGNQAAAGEGLVSFLGRQPGLVAVVLNGCHTHRLAEGLIAVGVPVVIGTDEVIDDELATLWATRFYRGLGAGLSIRRAFDDAVDEARMSPQASQLRGVYLESADAVPNALPWRIHVHPGKEEQLEWSLTQYDPLLGLPEPKAIDLPDPPFLFFRRYGRAYAPVFFGRAQHIRLLYGQIANPDNAPLILLHGQSGSGKSSLLEAGLAPRLEAEYEVIYLRRDEEQGLAFTLQSALEEQFQAGPGPIRTENDLQIEALLEELERRLQQQPFDRLLRQQLQELRALRHSRPAGAMPAVTGAAAPLLHRWHGIEARQGRPLVVILDQVEEVFTQRRQEEQQKEWRQFMGALQELFGNTAGRPQGKLLLGFRKEYYPEIEKGLQQCALPRSSVFLPTLTAAEIEEIVLGLASRQRLRDHYQLEVEPELPGIIAGELLQQENSAVAPVLQIMLTNMWMAAKEENPGRPRFTVALYRRLKREWWKLGQFVDAQFRAVGRHHPQAAANGLLLDLLFQHTTPGGASRPNSRRGLQQQYGHLAGIEGLWRSATQYLLLKEEAGVFSLSHDTLAPIVRARFQQSPLPGQRARRLLEGRAESSGTEAPPPLDRHDLRQVEQGLPYMRQLTAAEKALLASSRQAEKRRRLRRGAFLGTLGLLALTALGALWFGYRENLSKLSTQANLEELQEQEAQLSRDMREQREHLALTEADLGQKQLALRHLQDSTRDLLELAERTGERAEQAERRFRANQLAANALAQLQERQKYAALETAVAAYVQDAGSPAVLGALLAVAYDTTSPVLQAMHPSYIPTRIHPLNYRLEDFGTKFSVADSAGNDIFAYDPRDFIEEPSFLEGFTNRVYYRLGEKEQVVIWEPLLALPAPVKRGRIAGLGIGQDGRGILWATAAGRAGQYGGAASGAPDLKLEGSIRHLASHPGGQAVVTQATRLKLFERFALAGGRTLQPDDTGLALNTSRLANSGRFLAVGRSQGTVEVYRLEPDRISLESSLRPSATTAQVLEVLFSPDDRYLIAIDNQKTLYIWHWEQQRLVRETAFPGELTSLSFSPDGRTLLAGSRDGQVYRFPWRGHLTGPGTGPESMIKLPTTLTVAALSFRAGPMPHLAVAAGSEIYSYEWESLAPVWSYNLKQQVVAISFSADGKQLWIGTTEGLLSPILYDAGLLAGKIKEKQYLLPPQ